VIRILIADDQELVRTGFRVVLDAEPDFDVVGEGADGFAERSPANSSAATPPSKRTSHASSPSSTFTTVPKPSSSPTKADSSNQAKPPPKPDTQRLHPAMIQAWQSVWQEFMPFLEFPVELRKVVYATNAIESLNARFRRAVRHRGHFPNEQATLKVLYLVATQRRKNRSDMTGKISGSKSILNTLTIHYGDRIAANTIT